MTTEQNKGSIKENLDEDVLHEEARELMYSLCREYDLLHDDLSLDEFYVEYKEYLLAKDVERIEELLKLF